MRQLQNSGFVDFGDYFDRFLIIFRGVISVSYTHLDVYKRQPLGCPAEDYYRFLEGISWFNFWLNKEGALPSSVIESAQEAFKQGYAAFPSTITEEAHRYFSNYWVIKNYKFKNSYKHSGPKQKSLE